MNIKYNKTNREKRLTAVKDGFFWCGSCDAYLVARGAKCGNCGAKPVHRTLKKESNAR